MQRKNNFIALKSEKKRETPLYAAWKARAGTRPGSAANEKLSKL